MNPRSNPTHALNIAVTAMLALGSVWSAAPANASTFIPDMDDVIDSTPAPRPARAPRPSRKARRETAPKVEPTPETIVDHTADDAIASDSDTKSEVEKPCKSCRNTDRSIPVKRIAGLDQSSKFHSAQEKCYSDAIFEGAQSSQRANYNRSYSASLCAAGVQNHLRTAGVYPGGLLGDAISMQSSGNLDALGFKNFASEYPSPQDAPRGAILVFAGPASSEFITHRRKKYSFSCKIRHGRRVCKRSAGNWAGHITIAGEKRGKNNRWYYTDGRTEQPAMGWPTNKTTRRLVGVYLMQHCTGSCSRELRARCGG